MATRYALDALRDQCVARVMTGDGRLQAIARRNDEPEASA